MKCFKCGHHAVNPGAIEIIPADGKDTIIRIYNAPDELQATFLHAPVVFCSLGCFDRYFRAKCPLGANYHTPEEQFSTRGPWSPREREKHMAWWASHRRLVRSKYE
jgi:hypothetical protein